MRPIARSRRGAFAAAAFVVSCAALVAAQGTRPLRSDKTVSFKMDQLIDLQMTAGPVTVRSVKFQSNPRESIGARFRARAASDTETTIRAAFDAENPEKEEWEVNFVLEFIDAKGKVVDRVSRSSSWEGEAKIFNLDHPILTYALPFVDRVKISLSAKID